jgi:hypothetical protein
MLEDGEEVVLLDYESLSEDENAPAKKRKNTPAFDVEAAERQMQIMFEELERQAAAERPPNPPPRPTIRSVRPRTPPPSAEDSLRALMRGRCPHCGESDHPSRPRCNTPCYFFFFARCHNRDCHFWHSFVKGDIIRVRVQTCELQPQVFETDAEVREQVATFGVKARFHKEVLHEMRRRRVPLSLYPNEVFVPMACIKMGVPGGEK